MLVVAGLLLLAVLVIFVSPAFDMPDTTMRAKSLAQLLLLALIAIANLCLPDTAPVVAGYVIRDDCSSYGSPCIDSLLPLLC